MKRKLRNQYFELIRPYHSEDFNTLKYLSRNPTNTSNLITGSKGIGNTTLRKYCLFPNDNAVTSTLLTGSIYEPYIFDFIKDNLIDLSGTDIVEIGSNNGHFTIEFSELVGDSGRVFAFEPQRIIFQQLCCNVFLNGLDNVHAYQMALGKESGFTKIEYPNYFDEGYVNFGDVSVHREQTISNYESVRMEKLDSFDFNKVIIIKIDVQGYEPFVIEGSIETINKHRPFLFVEIEEESLEKFNFSESQLIEQIEKLDYVVKRFQEGIVYNTRTGVCLDCVCIPKEKFDSQNFIIT